MSHMHSSFQLLYLTDTSNLHEAFSIRGFSKSVGPAGSEAWSVALCH